MGFSGAVSHGGGYGRSGPASHADGRYEIDGVSAPDPGTFLGSFRIGQIKRGPGGQTGPDLKKLTENPAEGYEPGPVTAFGEMVGGDIESFAGIE
ncbi:MAG: hypothetical protein ACYCRD_11185 [Leptospirillum sp.]